MAIHEWMQMQEPNLYCDRIVKFMQRWDIHMALLRDYVEK
jgi:hypothetical protein